MDELTRQVDALNCRRDTLALLIETRKLLISLEDRWLKPVRKVKMEIE